MAWASTGVVRSATTPILGMPGSIWLDRASDGTRYRVDYEAEDDRITVSSVAPFTGTLPPYGAAYHCDAMPHTFDDPLASSGWEIFAEVCYEPPGLWGTCQVHGDVDATPEDDHCSSGLAMALGFDPASGLGVAYPPDSWVIDAHSAGTFVDYEVFDIPLGVDVTIGATAGSVGIDVVARWESGNVTVQSVTPR